MLDRARISTIELLSLVNEELTKIPRRSKELMRCTLLYLKEVRLLSQKTNLHLQQSS